METPDPNDDEEEHGLNSLSEEAIEPDVVQTSGQRWTTSLMNTFPPPILSLQYQESAISWQERSLLALQTPCHPCQPSLPTIFRIRPKSSKQTPQPTSSLAGSRRTACNKAQRLDPKPVTIVVEHLLEAELCI